MKSSHNEPIDISVPVCETMVTWPGDPRPEFQWEKTIAQGGTSNTSRFSMGSHNGTHVDAPLHFVEDAAAADGVPLDVLVGPARVLDLTGREVITAEALERQNLNGAIRILLKTDASAFWADDHFHEQFPHLDDDAARLLVDRRVKLVGVDYLSVEQYKGRTRETHRILLGGGVVIIESMNLSGVAPGDYELICLPLRLKGLEAAPARAILRRPA